MHRIRIYVDNSVFGGVYDEEFADTSKRFFDRVHRGDYLVVVSQIVFDEIEDAPAIVQQVLKDLPDNALEIVRLDDEVLQLAEAYISARVLGRAAEFDALQVAAATVARVDLIPSWNFEHIVNYDRIQKFNAVNMLNGYGTLDIRSPKEVAYGDQDEDL